ncbi:MAG: hypothetical protein OQK77_03190 [Psychromonas sp.]|nr:hypothetical protein [Psychromonas sp.]
MANINAHLPSAVAAAFHPPTENLQHDNLIKPVIPKTEIIASYSKLRDEEHRSQFSAQAREIVQDKNQQTSDKPAHQNASLEQRRTHFFARRRKSFTSDSDSGDEQAAAIKDFKEIISVIQTHYENAVRPLPTPTILYAV